MKKLRKVYIGLIMAFLYAPILLLTAIPAGAVTGLVVNVTYPHLRHISKSFS